MPFWRYGSCIPVAEYPHKVNIFVDAQSSAKLADFGLAIIIEATTGGMTTASAPKGTVAWMSPERNNVEGPVLRLAPSMDVYSFGILCYTVTWLHFTDVFTTQAPFLGLDKNAPLSRHERPCHCHESSPRGSSRTTYSGRMRW
jgi:serine/threonine protein kinase